MRFYSAQVSTMLLRDCTDFFFYFVTFAHRGHCMVKENFKLIMQILQKLQSTFYHAT